MYWKTKDGRLLRPCDMSTEHLVNALDLCIRNEQVRALRCAVGWGLKGFPMTALALANTADDPETLRYTAMRRLPITREMEAEVLRRRAEENRHA